MLRVVLRVLRRTTTLLGLLQTIVNDIFGLARQFRGLLAAVFLLVFLPDLSLTSLTFPTHTIGKHDRSPPLSFSPHGLRHAELYRIRKRSTR